MASSDTTTFVTKFVITNRFCFSTSVVTNISTYQVLNNFLDTIFYTNKIKKKLHK